jgi:hypothetical protein
VRYTNFRKQEEVTFRCIIASVTPVKCYLSTPPYIHANDGQITEGNG